MSSKSVPAAKGGTATGKKPPIALQCECCGETHDMSWGTGRFCSITCARRVGAQKGWERRRSSKNASSSTASATVTQSRTSRSVSVASRSAPISTAGGRQHRRRQSVPRVSPSRPQPEHSPRRSDLGKRHHSSSTLLPAKHAFDPNRRPHFPAVNQGAAQNGAAQTVWSNGFNASANRAAVCLVYVPGIGYTVPIQSLQPQYPAGYTYPAIGSLMPHVVVPVHAAKITNPGKEKSGEKESPPGTRKGSDSTRGVCERARKNTNLSISSAAGPIQSQERAESRSKRARKGTSMPMWV